jgi:alkanesulfonate monooxygenase SsuD/methylene tetrahydromethanopterin reductase-like flavin-dependent oxidoreductase (luciferase family)
LVNCAPTQEESYAIARESFEWYPKRSAELVSSVTTWLREQQQELGSYEYLSAAQQIVESGLHEKLSFDLLREMNACVCGDPDEVLARCRAYEATGADLLLCLVNPYRISHEHVMQTIELMGKHVIPQLDHEPR